MAKAYENRVALITGAARGIGQALAEGFGRSGASVIGLDLRDSDETATLVKQSGASWLGLRGDITVENDISSAMQEVRNRYGRLDILINCAGILPQVLWDDLNLATWNRLMAVNATSQFLMAKSAVPLMREHSFGRIVNFTAAIVQTPASGFIAYMASKMAVVGLTRGLATELGPQGITVNAVSPSFVTTPGQIEAGNGHLQSLVTDRQAIKRDQVPQDIVGLVLFLASEAAAFITAQTIHADGGLTYH